ncbi:LysR family transcriptional regulator [Curtobacterium flaccumfaciens]|uniref:LysR family transcriptional regulator n=1 Tax=Curtobacterium flaccumfaciens TaxID=2035 RepID=UPI001889EC55|nr:LysR family transcriptional regulator [Curtobacterium flaccumfaciens]MBF4595656.1 LysR family transcriptional regulator [Curtobacterium flaccumfaciens]
MDVRQLEYFVAVAEEHNFGRAAERLHVVQSAVSAGVRSLERDLGASLFARGNRRSVLTDAGEALLPRALIAIDAMRDAQDAVGEVSGGLRGTLRIGTLTSVPLFDVPAALGEFHHQHPRVRLVTGDTAAGSTGLVAALLAHQLDLAFVALSGQTPVGIDVTVLGRSRLGIALPPGHRLSDHPRISLRELSNDDFIDLPPGFGNRELVDRACSSLGFRRRVVLEITDIGTATSYVQHGLGIAVLPVFLLYDVPGITVAEIADEPLWWSFGVAWSSTRPLAAAGAALLRIIQEMPEAELSGEANHVGRSIVTSREQGVTPD